MSMSEFRQPSDTSILLPLSTISAVKTKSRTLSNRAYRPLTIDEVRERDHMMFITSCVLSRRFANTITVSLYGAHEN
eukprot:2165760-Pleurochrysis_carterae.AAC.3